MCAETVTPLAITLTARTDRATTLADQTSTWAQALTTAVDPDAVRAAAATYEDARTAYLHALDVPGATDDPTSASAAHAWALRTAMVTAHDRLWAPLRAVDATWARAKDLRAESKSVFRSAPDGTRSHQGGGFGKWYSDSAAIPDHCRTTDAYRDLWQQAATALAPGGPVATASALTLAAWKQVRDLTAQIVPVASAATPLPGPPPAGTGTRGPVPGSRATADPTACCPVSL